MIHKEIVGLDLGARTARAVRAVRMGGRLVVRRSARTAVPASGPERVRVLRAFLKQNGMEGVPLVLALDGPDLMLNTLEIPPEDPRPLRSIVRLEYDRIAELSDGATISDDVSFRLGARRFALLGVARADTVDRYAGLAQALDMPVADIVPRDMALYRGVYELSRLRGTTACIDIEPGGTHVTIGHRDKVIYSRFFAHRMLPETSEGFVLPDAWLDELRTCLDGYRAAHRGGIFEPDQVVVAGAGADNVETVARIGAAVGLPARRVRDLGRAERVAHVEEMAVAAGMAACGLRRGGAGISLLSPAVREVRVLRWQRRYWGLSAACLVACLGVLILADYAELRWERAVLQLRQVELAGLRGLDRKLGMLQGLNEDLERQVQPFRSAVHNAAVLQVVLEALGECKDPGDWLCLVADAEAYFGDAPEGVLPPSVDIRPGQGRFTQIIVEGYTPEIDYSTVLSMIEALRSRAGIVDVDLLGDERVRLDVPRDNAWDPTGCRIFALEITVPTP